MYTEVPIRNAIPAEGYAHVDYVPVIQLIHPFPIDSIVHNPKDDTITVTFRGGVNPYTSQKLDFELVETYSVNESFVFGCGEFEWGTHLSLYGYQDVTVMDDIAYLSLWHDDRTTQEHMPCTYPDVIIHSRGVVPAKLFHAALDRSFFPKLPQNNPMQTDH